MNLILKTLCLTHIVVSLNFQIGSTEWVEQNLATLDSKAVAYINVDCAVQGPGLFAGATPQLDDLLVEVTKKVRYIKNGELKYQITEKC